MERQINRRAVLLGIAGMALAGALPAAPASAGRAWCRRDPLFRINGQMVNVWVSIEEGGQYESTGPIKVVLSVPHGVDAEHISSDEGYGFGYDVKIIQDGKLNEDSDRKEVEIKVKAFVPARTKRDVLVEFVPDAGVLQFDSTIGKTNRWVSVRTRAREEWSSEGRKSDD